MWYFAWMLGITAAIFFGIINAMWLENDLFNNKDLQLDD
jgi:cyd operon protein YbgT